MAEDKRKNYKKTGNNEAIPGDGVIFHADELTLKETTILTEREIYAFAVGDVKAEMSNPRRKKKVHELLREALLRYKKSLDGRGIDDIKLLYQVSNEEKREEAHKGAMFG